MVYVGIAKAPESAKVGIRDRFVEQGCERFFVLDSFGREKIK